MKYLAVLLLLTAAFPALAAIPATPVMTLYRFNGDLDIPYYSLDGVARGGARAKYVDLSGGRLTSLSRREQNHARGLLLAGYRRSAVPEARDG